MNKTCAYCKTDLPEELFRWKNKSKGWRQPYCIECNKKYNRQHYKENKRKYLEKAQAYNSHYKKEISERLFDYFSSNHCVDCGNSDPRVLEFDHVRGKSKNISSMISDKNAWNKILDEISKCEVRCANCHRIVTMERAGAYRIDWI